MTRTIKNVIICMAFIFGVIGFHVVASASDAGIVNLSSGSLNVRAGEGTNYVKVGSIANGASVTVVSNDGDWLHIQANGIDGYVASQYVKIGASAAATASSSGTSYGTRYVGGQVGTLNVRSGPGTNYSKIGSLTSLTPVTVVDKSGDWAKINFNNGTGWVLAVYLDIQMPTLVTNASNLSSRSGGGSVDGARLAEYASSSKFLGIPYKYGGASLSGFDCSGFTMYVYKQFGIDLPHSSSAQYGYGVSVAKADLQPGDLVFFSSTSGGSGIGHVGIYIGNGQFVDAHTYGQPLGISDLNNASYVKRYVGARRILN